MSEAGGRLRSTAVRRLLRLAHLWIGLCLGLPLALIGATGSILVFEHEVATFFDPPPRRAATGGAEQPVGAIIAAARKAAPAGFAPSTFFAPEGPDGLAAVRLSPPGQRGPGGTTTVLVDPVTLDARSARSPSDGVDLMREIFLLHANLSMQGRTGREIVGWFGVAMLLLGLSGLVLWWPRGGRWKTAFGVQRRAKGYRFNRQLHGAVGFWGLAVFMIVSFSGVYLVFPQTVGEGMRSIAPGRDLRAAMRVVRAEPAEDGTPIGIDRAIALARQEPAVGAAVLRSIFLPRAPEQPYRIGFSAAPGPQESPGHGPPQITVFIDPWQARVAALFDPRRYSAGETAMAWQHPLHAGAGLGWGWKLLVFLSGLLPLLFAITGLSMWVIKRRARRSAGPSRTERSIPVGGAETVPSEPPPR